MATKVNYSGGDTYLATGFETAIAGERNTSSSTNSYLVVRNECNATILAKTGAITIGAGAASDTHLIGIRIHTALVGTLTITGFADSDGAATSYVVPIGVVGDIDFRGALNTAGAITMTLSSATDYTTNKSVMVFWRPV